MKSQVVWDFDHARPANASIIEQNSSNITTRKRLFKQKIFFSISKKMLVF